MVSPVSSDNKKSDEYWMGVRDALRMVDSFNKWAKRNPSRAKNLDDFIHDGLIAAAKRCESCLSEKLGLSFSAEDEEEAEYDEILVEQEDTPEYETSIEFDESPLIEDDMQDFEASLPSSEMSSESIDRIASYEMAPEEESLETEIKTEISPKDSDEIDELPSIDNVARRDDETLDDLDTEGPPRDFSSDFALVEPAPLIVDEYEEEAELDEFHDSEISDEDVVTEDESDTGDDRGGESSFTWADYEAAVTPSSEPDFEESDDDVLSPIDDEIDEEPLEDVEITEPPEPPKIWSSSSESSISDDELDDLKDADNEEAAETDNIDITEDVNQEADVMKPPPPPPPPESEEDEEERKRRARRLFFGA